jgi:hypothetical protein
VAGYPEDASAFTVKPSTVVGGGGRGLFAGRAFARGELVCWYYGYLVEKSQASRAELEYALTYGSSYLIGYMVPRKEAPAGVAQLANDSVRPLLDEFPRTAPLWMRLRYVARVMAEYEMESLHGANLETVPGTVAYYRARRDIVEGEELFISYTGSYWAQWYRDRGTDNPELERTLDVAQGTYVLAVRDELAQPGGRRLLDQSIYGFAQDDQFAAIVITSIRAWLTIAKVEEKDLDESNLVELTDEM